MFKIDVLHIRSFDGHICKAGIGLCTGRNEPVLQVPASALPFPCCRTDWGLPDATANFMLNVHRAILLSSTSLASYSKLQGWGLWEVLEISYCATFLVQHLAVDPLEKIFWSSTFVGPPLPLASISLQSNRVLLAQSLFLCSCWWGAPSWQISVCLQRQVSYKLGDSHFFFFFLNHQLCHLYT